MYGFMGKSLTTEYNIISKVVIPAFLADADNSVGKLLNGHRMHTMLLYVISDITRHRCIIAFNQIKHIPFDSNMSSHIKQYFVLQ